MIETWYPDAVKLERFRPDPPGRGGACGARRPTLRNEPPYTPLPPAGSLLTVKQAARLMNANVRCASVVRELARADRASLVGGKVEWGELSLQTRFRSVPSARALPVRATTTAHG
jgi:hypothetical protein